ncbi:Ino eighty subunit 2, partial [Lecanoromycetidae sp. Uapishka_2]
MPERRSTRVRATLTKPSPPAPSPASTRPRRAASGASSSIKVTRVESNSPEDTKKALRLTVKMPSNKLRETTSDSRPTSRGNAAAALKDSLTGGEIVRGPRASRANKKYIVESESDEEEDEDEDDEIKASNDEEDEEEEVDDEEEEEEPVQEEEVGGPEESSEDEDQDEEEEEEDDDADADGDAEADGDIDMEDDADDGQPLPSQTPILKINGPASKPVAKTPSKAAAKPVVTVTPAQDAKVKSVEAKEMEMDDDDEELSDLSENDDEDDEGDAGEEDAEGEDVDMEDDESRSPGSRGSTPDVSKMTKRQRSRLDQVMGSDFLQLPMEPQIKKHLTVEEHAMRRAEMARRRKNLSEKRNEEEKMDTINRLLKKQAPKRRGKISQAEITAQEHGGGGDESPPEIEEEQVPPANPVYVRWISNKDGCRLGVPGQWFGQPVGAVFGERKMVEEVEG